MLKNMSQLQGCLVHSEKDCRAKNSSKKLVKSYTENLALSGSYKSNDLATCVRKSITVLQMWGCPQSKQNITLDMR